MVEAIHLSFVKYILLLAGCYHPSKYKKKLDRYVYIFYKYMFDIYFVTNCLLLVIGMLQNMDCTPIVAETFSYALLFGIIYIINIQVKSPKVTNIFVDMEKQEVNYVKFGNSDVLKILKYYANINHSINKSVAVIVLFFSIYFVVSKRFISNKPLYYQYYPFDREHFAVLELIFHVMFLYTCDIYFIFSKASIIMLIMYMMFRLKTVQYFLKNLDHFTTVTKERFKISENDARYCVVKSIVKDHCSVIE